MPWFLFLIGLIEDRTRSYCYLVLLIDASNLTGKKKKKNFTPYQFVDLFFSSNSLDDLVLPVIINKLLIFLFTSQ